MSKVSTPEMRIVWLAALIQLVNALDFMMVMPLGPDLSRELGISPTYIGYLGGGYTLAAALSSLLCAKFIDRFDRKSVALVALLGLSAATWACTRPGIWKVCLSLACWQEFAPARLRR
ncbi:membrane protein of unknown function [Serratia sp. Tan611]|nr:MFS transporter [Serratia sp. Tan611]CAE1149134.1 membrane protein of unknown function [Serratia sp. Tan611]